ncbi:hypothetical protein NA57DRAFT_80315 [Rhizodiscina lignyota]|uniref:BTB domain-containing protein n=1 Tax=Rhizodiscina lignyota TaxID=1504668 RepID=A0A9P4M1D9_9PEZI|nr:hypothetical protein NA57DRAFT_80315 [Rhizodiscina lignyota]
MAAPMKRNADEAGLGNPSDVRKHAKHAPPLGLDMIMVYVGQQAERFPVHANILYKSSRFSTADVTWHQIGHEGFIRLPEQEPEIFKIFVQWLYSGHIYSAHEGDDSGNKESCEWSRLCGLYLLGDDLRDYIFKNAVIDAVIMRALVTNEHPSGFVEHIYTHTTGSDPMRKLLADFWVWSAADSLEGDYEDLKKGPLEFWKDVAQAMCRPVLLNTTPMRSSRGRRTNASITNTQKASQSAEQHPGFNRKMRIGRRDIQHGEVSEFRQ